MLFPEQVKPLLSHADFHVREAAINYFSDSYSPDPEVLPQVLSALPQDGEDRVGVLADCHGLVVSDAGLTALLPCLAREDDSLARGHLKKLIFRAPFELLLARMADLEPLAANDPRTARQLLRYQKAAGWPAERRWRRLQKEAKKEEPSWNIGEVLVHALVAQAVPDEETLVKLVTLQEGPNYLESYAIELASKRRLGRAVAPLVDNMHFDDDFALEDSSRALARIGDVEAAHRIHDAWPKAEKWFRNFSTEVLGHLKHPDAEEVILELFEAERDTSVRTGLCQNLCELFSERGVEVVRRQIRSGYDRMLLSLEESLLPVLDALGIDLPEASRWREQRIQQERRTGAAFEQLRKMQEAPPPPPWSGLADPDDDWREPPPMTPIVREGPKVGRNEPCPCGSGKKFKNCCLRRD